MSVSDHPERWTTATSASAIERVRQAARAQLHGAWSVFADQFGALPELHEEPPGALAFLAVVVSQWSGARAHLQQHRPAFHQALMRLEALEFMLACELAAAGATP